MTHIGLTKHAFDRVRERIPTLAYASGERIRADVARMVEIAQPFHNPGGVREPLWRTTHEESGDDYVLAIKDQKGCAVRLVITVMTLEQAKKWKRKPKATCRRVDQKHARIGRRRREFVRDAGSDFDEEA